MKVLLLDTGPLVALLDARDSAHVLVCERFGELDGRVVTTGAVITEAMFHVQDLRDGPLRLVRFLEELQAEVTEVFDAVALQAAAALMQIYRKTPMDFADATLVIMAERLNCPDILTLDERGFATFRYSRNRRFHLILQA